MTDNESEKADDIPHERIYELVADAYDTTPDEAEEVLHDAFDVEENKGNMIGKPFEGPEGQGPFEDYQACVVAMEDESGIDDPEGWCAQAHYDDTGEWPSEADEDGEQKVYIGSHKEAPENVVIDTDEKGLFYRQQPYEHVREEYPDEMDNYEESEYEEEQDEDDEDE